MTEVFATLADVLGRYPQEATVLAANEQTRERDDQRIEASLIDASAEIRVILFAKYTRADLDRIDNDSREALRIYATDIALYRVALGFGRGNEKIEKRYDIAIKRLEAIGSGKASLSFDGPGGGGSGSTEAGDPTSIGPGEAIVQAPERMFTRHRLRGL